MDRRAFLDPRQAASLAGQAYAGARELRSAVAEATAEPVDEFAMLCHSRRAMATHFEVLLPLGTANATALANAALDEIDRLEDQLTVYRDSSEVSRLNRTAARQPVEVEAGLFELLQLCAGIGRETGGAFDVATNALIKAWGFFRGPPRVPTREERLAALARSGMRHVVLEHETGSVRFLCDGIEINLGSIGKGYALDRAAALCQRMGLRSGLLHGGKSSALAVGSAPGTERGWPVAIRHPADPERPLATVWLKNQALGTSAATFRHLQWQGRRLGHVLDPRTGWPAEGMLGVSVVAPTAALADALATAFFVLGMDAARAFCARHPEIGVIGLVDQEGSRPVVVGSMSAELASTGVA